MNDETKRKEEKEFDLLCPMTGRQCAEEKCAWFDPRFRLCAVAKLGYNTGYLANLGLR